MFFGALRHQCSVDSRGICLISLQGWLGRLVRPDGRSIWDLLEDRSLLGLVPADVENGGASPTPSYRSRHTSERDLVLEWKKNKAQTSIVVAKELLRRASRAKERARIARTETAIATAAMA